MGINIDTSAIKNIVVKVGTSTLTYENGKLNLDRMDRLCFVIADLINRGLNVTLVSSGAIGVGVSKLGLKERPTKTMEKQAAAAVGQCELMFIYDKIFSQYGCKTAQVLLTKDVIDDVGRRENAQNTFDVLLKMGVIPIVNENDAVSVEEIEFGDNDTLSAVVASLVKADLLIIMSDIDGLYTADPRTNKDAKIIHKVTEINDELLKSASGAGTNRGTGGMITKLTAAKFGLENGIKTVICNGSNPKILEDIMKGKIDGTIFTDK